MFRAFNEYIGKINLVLDQSVIDKLVEITEEDENIKSVTVNVSFNKYIVDIRLNEFSVEVSDRLFRRLVQEAAYPYSHISIRYNENTRVKYRFATCKEDKTGVYMDVVFS